MLRTWNKAQQNKWNVFVQDPGIKELVLFMFRIAFQLKNPLGVVTVKFTENTVEGNDQRQF